jgi:AdoMet-dependent heme synthase
MYSKYETLKHWFEHSKLVYRKRSVLYRVACGYFRTLVLRQPVLRTVEIAVTPECNSNCIMCYASKIKCESDNILSTKEYADLWQQSKKLGAFSVIISGGEPSIRPDIIDVINCFEPKNNLLAFVTNSIEVDRRFLEELKRIGVNTFHFSLDSTDPGENDRIRGYEGHYNKALAAIENAKSLGLNTYISTVIGLEDIDKMGLMVDFARDKEIGVVFSLACPTGKWAGKEDMLLTPEAWESVVKKMKENLHIRADWTINFSMRVECPGGREKLAISPYGEVTGCGMNYISFGNIREEALRKIWRRMGNFPEFKRRSPICLIGADQNYINEYLLPLADNPQLPVRIHDHPKNPISFGELDGINE